MNTLRSFLRLIRTGNLLIMLVTLVMSYYFLNGYLLLSDLLRLKFICLLCATLLTGAAGYIINDYYDVKLDLVNKPGKVIVGNAIPRRWAMLLHSWFNIIAVALALFVNTRVALAVFLCGILLMLYSVYFKKQFLAGNLVIAFLSAFVLLILPLFDSSVPLYLVLSYALFAFLITLSREIIKDAEDMKGDSQFDCRTMPIVIGIRRTKRVLLYLHIVFILLLSGYMFIAVGNLPFNHDYARLMYIGYMLLFVILPFSVITYLLSIADVKSDFSRLSLLTKIVMLTGMLSMVWLRV